MNIADFIAASKQVDINREVDFDEALSSATDVNPAVAIVRWAIKTDRSLDSIFQDFILDADDQVGLADVSRILRTAMVAYRNDALAYVLDDETGQPTVVFLDAVHGLDALTENGLTIDPNIDSADAFIAAVESYEAEFQVFYPNHDEM